MTEVDLIRRSLRMLGAQAPGEDLPPAQLVDGRTALQGMLGQWGTQKLTMHVVSEQTLTLISGTASYTVGSGGTFNIARPTFVDRASLIDLTNPTSPIEYPITVIRTPQDWQQIQMKSLTGAMPQAIYWQPTFPLATLTLWPIPNVSTLRLRLYVRDRITGFASPTTNYTFADGYEDALAYNLALRLAHEWGAEVPPTIEKLARETLANVKRVNQDLNVLRLDPAVHAGTGRGGYDIWSDR